VRGLYSCDSTNCTETGLIDRSLRYGVDRYQKGAKQKAPFGAMGHGMNERITELNQLMEYLIEQGIKRKSALRIAMRAIFGDHVSIFRDEWADAAQEPSQEDARTDQQ